MWINYQWILLSRLVSDGPVRSRLPVRVSPIEGPIFLNFQKDAVLQHYERLSPSFFVAPDLGYPAIAEGGFIDVPTVASGGGTFVFVARVVVDGGPQGDPLRLTIHAKGKLLHGLDIPGGRLRTKGGHPYWLSFAVPGERLREGTTPQQAQAETDVLVAGWLETYPDAHIRPDGHEIQFEPLTTQVIGDVRPALLTLLGFVKTPSAALKQMQAISASAPSRR